ncbi:DHA1 family inner membrane transport protein [Frondihabitans australicus]|uniref:DHA1 family inner membrane transport protein n=2 Tax=Frondihabitans australicus TaxID=386892 RepID=A0A495IDM5_9MICO|nr:DHA1 family inner membrane transport protein [Frondihabitans australicus]
MSSLAPAPLSATRRRLALLSLAMGGFGIGATEFVAMGLLPNIAHQLLPTAYAASAEDATAHAGILISAYALGVVIGAPTIAATTSRMPRKKLLLMLLAAFVVGSVASAVLPTFGLVVLARFVAGLPHGAYFGIASLAAANLMGPGNRGKGVAFVMAGLTISNVVGVPLITALGQAAGWRVAYGVVATIFALTFIAVAIALPHQPAAEGASIKRELSAFGKPQVWLVMGVGAIGFGGFFAVDSYVSTAVTQGAGAPEAVVPFVLVGIGLGMTVGNLLGGWGSDKSIGKTLVVGFTGLLVALAGYALTSHAIAGIFVFAFLLGTFSSMISPAIQTRLMVVAGDSQVIAAALNHSAFNIGNSLGAFLGGVVIAAGLGAGAPAWVGFVLALFGIALTAISFAAQRRSTRRDGLTGATPATQPVPIAGL